MPISPNEGSTGGGTLVAITGTNLSNAGAVKVGSASATNVTQVSPTQITAVSPSGAGTVGIAVTTPGGVSNPVSFFYVGAPFESSLSATSGPLGGGNVITINGTGLSTATSVSFGTVTATPTVVSDSQISVAVPAAGTNNGLSYTYIAAPAITTIAPNSGPMSGGTAVTITGTSFATTESVTFGAVHAPFTVINDTTLSVVVPPTPDGGAGPSDVRVTNAAGTVLAADGFTYLAAPGI